MQEWYFEDIPMKQPMTTSEYLVPAEEMIAFAQKWDPSPLHIDPEAAKSSPLGGVIASSVYTLAISTALGHGLGTRMVMVGGAEWQIRLLVPVRPGDRFVETVECIEKRQCRTKPDRGIVRFLSIVQNQNGQRVLELEATSVVSRRPIHQGTDTL